MKHYYKLRKSLLVALAIFGSAMISNDALAQLYPFDTHTFTNGGAEGRTGPTLGAVVAEYTGMGATWAADPAFLNMTTQGIQEWTVPATGDSEIEVAGAQGGYHAYTVDPEDGGLGAVITGTFDFTEGQVLYILVGQEGDPSQTGGGFSEDNAAPGGGGGSFIWDPTDDALPLMAAGGGGAGASPGSYALKDATIADDGNPTQGLSNGGLDGNGGRNNTGSCSWWAGAGAGWLTNGTGGNQFSTYNYLPGSSGAQGGRRALDNGLGGVRWNDGSDEGGDGGFGGGGGGGSDNMNGGGGGGFSGGGGGRGCEISPGGGGSYNGGIDQTNVVANTGHGYVTITQLCEPLTVSITDIGVCIGEEITITGTSPTGGTITWDMGVTNGVPFTPVLGATTVTATSTSPDDCPYAVTVYASEVPEITANSSLPSACEGAVITLWGEGGMAVDDEEIYTWTATDGSTPEDSVAFPAADGSVTYTVSGSYLGCAGPDAEITLVSAPQPDVEGTATPEQVCLGESYVLTGSGDGAVTFEWGALIEDGEPVTPAAAGTFAHMVVGFSDDGCTDTAFVFVDVLPTPIVDAGDDFTVCSEDDITLMGSGAMTYEWDPAVTDGEAFPAVAGETTYTVTGTDMNGCTDDDEIVVTAIERPYVASSVVTDEYYGYDGAIDITAAGGSGDYIYSWSHGPTTEDVDGLTSGVIYTVTIDDITTDPGLCSGEESFTLMRFIGIGESEQNGITAYPNPTNDQVTISYNGTFNYVVVNMLGEEIMTGNGYDNAIISMEELANGTYIVQVNANEKTNFIQIVKQ